MIVSVDQAQRNTITEDRLLLGKVATITHDRSRDHSRGLVGTMEIDEELAVAVRARVGRAVCGGRYSIEDVLGVGGMAAVYAGTHRNGRKVAIKFLHPELSRRADIRKRFIREGQAANAVEHAGVVAVIDDDVAEDGSAFLVMERLEGKSLEQLWQNLDRRLPARAVLAIGREICDVLAVAHRAGIYHRDLKPENLFLTNDGKLKVLDFGLAHLRDAARPKETHTGMVFGTPAFMPPEQASGETSKIDARTDLWAVGATLFTLLSGELVHRGETAQHFVMLAAMEPARSLALVMPHAHPALVDIVDRALCREKDARWQTATDMRDAIVSAMDLVLGDRDASLPTPSSLIEMVKTPKARVAAPKPPSASDEVKPKAAAVVAVGVTSDLDETFSDRTRVDARIAQATDSAPDTQPNAVAVITGAGSDTPTEQTTPDELPTQVRVFEDAPTVHRKSEQTPVDRGKRAGRTDQHKANGDVPSRNMLNAAPFQDETQLLAPPPQSDRTRVIGRDLAAVANARAAAPSSHSFAIPGDRPSYPAAIAIPRASQRTSPSIKRRSTQPIPYLPVVAAAILLGLSPLAYFLARNWGSSAKDARPPSISSAPASSGAIASARVLLPPTTPAPLTSAISAPSATAYDPSPGATTSPAAVTASAPTTQAGDLLEAPPRPKSPPAASPSLAVPPNPYRRDPSNTANAPLPVPSTTERCAPPYRIDEHGKKIWKPECF